MGLQISVKGVDQETFREFKAEAVRKGIKIGDALNLSMNMWINSRKTTRKKLLDFEPKNGGKGTEKTSENIDNILYEE